MEKLTLILISAFSGVIFSAIFFFIFQIIQKFSKNKQEEGALYLLLSDFKKTIDEYKLQNELNSNLVKDALKPAMDLAKILTTNQNLKGKFAEDCLENIIRAVYPNENIDYIKQIELKNIDDDKIRPDYLIKLPNNNSILIDCKLNLEKYIEYKESLKNGADLELIKKNEFIKDLNSTVNNLSNKKYETAQTIAQPDFILMYIPLEPVTTLIYTDSDFLNVVKNANDKNIIIVGVSSILAVLRLAKLVWAKHCQNENIENIIENAQIIYDLIAKHSQNLYEMKTVLEENLKNFNKEYEKITSDNKLFKSIEQLRQYGLNATKRKQGRKLEETIVNSDFLR